MARRLGILVIVIVVAAAAGLGGILATRSTITGNYPNPTSTSSSEIVSTTTSAISTTTAVSPAKSPVPTPVLPAWMSANLKDARTSQSLTLADFRGKVIVLEIMAIWCPTCREQGNEIQKAINTLSPEQKDKVVFISVDVDPNENERDLARYADTYKRTWPFVYDLTGVFLKEFINSKGGSVQTEIPTAPVYIISPDGTVSKVPGNGAKSADVMISSITGVLGSG